jgi:hypothetical protein
VPSNKRKLFTRSVDCRSVMSVLAVRITEVCYPYAVTESVINKQSQDEEKKRIEKRLLEEKHDNEIIQRVIDQTKREQSLLAKKIGPVSESAS